MNFFQKHRPRTRTRRTFGENNTKRRPRTAAVGTEAKAIEALHRNQQLFRYPKEGFSVKIEYSLLWAMIRDGTETFPSQVVKNAIEEEDFYEYMVVEDSGKPNEKNPSARQSAESSEGSHAEEEEDRVSYAQLSAILSLSAEKMEKNNASQNAYNSQSSNETLPSRRSNILQDRKSNDEDDTTVPELLCKRILQAVVRYAERHGLDRETELTELLAPVKRVAEARASKTELRAILPLYAGYTAALLTGNPLPMLVGAVAMSKVPDNSHELENMHSIEKQTSRAADVERAGLLDEAEDEFY